MCGSQPCVYESKWHDSTQSLSLGSDTWTGQGTVPSRKVVCSGVNVSGVTWKFTARVTAAQYSIAGGWLNLAYTTHIWKAPLILGAIASLITSHRNLHLLADERLLRSLDVLQEEAAKTFELTNLTMSNASDLVAGMSGGDIHQNGERLHDQFKKYSDAVAVIQSIWIYGVDGRALTST